MTNFADTLPPRQRALDDMLTHYADVQDTLFNGKLGSGDGVTQMPDVWRKSGYPRLEALLRLLRAEFEAEETWPPYWHVREWYFRSVRVRRPVMRRDKKGRLSQAILQGVPQYELVVVRYQGLPDHVVAMGERQVRRALKWIDEAWPREGCRQPETVQDIGKRLEDEKKRRVAA